MKRAGLVIVVVAAAGLITGARADEKKDMKQDMMKDCPMHAQHMAAHAAHGSEVDARGDQAMGFSHQTTRHHFLLHEDGGAIVVNATGAGDSSSRDAIRQHLKGIAEAFMKGQFDTPMFIHDGMPPGADTMQSLSGKIRYEYADVPAGGRVKITTTDAKALDAVHRFLRFQIEEHRTGDPAVVQPAE